LESAEKSPLTLPATDESRFPSLLSLWNEIYDFHAVPKELQESRKYEEQERTILDLKKNLAIVKAAHGVTKELEEKLRRDNGILQESLDKLSHDPSLRSRSYWSRK
jgi:hypothetical protein